MAKSQTRVTKTKSTPAATTTTTEVVVEDKGGMNWQDGVAIFTTIALLAACLVCLKALGEYGYGMFA
jgi:hypothetical protein